MATPGEGANAPGERDGQKQASSNDVSTQPHEPAHTVRFDGNMDKPDQLVVDQPRDDPSVTPEQIEAITNCLHGTQLQERRARNFSFQPFSLPPSRIPSTDTTPGATPQHSHSPLAPRSPHFGPSSSGLTPPLTPAYTPADQANNRASRQMGPDGTFLSSEFTPQGSNQNSNSRPSSRLGLPHRPASSDNLGHKTAFVEDPSNPRLHRKGMFSMGTGGQSLPVSRESSPSRNPASQFYTRPFSLHGDANDPYAASKRPAQNKNIGQIDQRFVFSRKKNKTPSISSSSLRLTDKSDKRSSSLLGVRNKFSESSSGTPTGGHAHRSSMSDLRRFFKVGGSSKLKRLPQSPITSGASELRSSHLPFGDDHALSTKYGKIGRVLGSGAGGSVKLMKRSEDNTVFAVKEFRPRNSYETEKEYVKKLTAEFCFGSALHHGNIIETLDIVQEKGKWYEVMEYAPYDLFAIVMTGKMSKEEINCCFLQILSGVTYLHGSGLAHRDLKLDNVVVGENGIMKIIDFGSAHVFKYPFESDIVLASGIVGSDPYLAPEVYEERKYDPQAVDIWSLAIIFCCMSLRRFPWKLPRLTDNSYKLFASAPTPGYNPKQLILPSRPTNDSTSNSALPQEVVPDSPKSPKPSKADPATPSGTDNGERKEVIKGPWRLLRLLPRESRHIIYRMLTIDPKERAKMTEILDEPWVSDTVICRQVGPGQFEKADHTHILEPPAPAAPK